MDNHMLVCQIKNVKDLVPFVSGTIKHRKEKCHYPAFVKGLYKCHVRLRIPADEKILLDPYIISALIIDCDFSMSLYERIYVFDLCFISQEGALWFDPEQRNGLRFFAAAIRAQIFFR